MSEQEFNLLSGIAGSLSLTTLLFIIWILERKERIKCQGDMDKHLASDIERLLDETENLRKLP